MASNLPRPAHEEHLALLARLTDALFVRHTTGTNLGTPMTNTTIVVRSTGPPITYMALNITDPAIRLEFQNLVLRMSVRTYPFLSYKKLTSLVRMR